MRCMSICINGALSHMEQANLSPSPVLAMTRATKIAKVEWLFLSRQRGENKASAKKVLLSLHLACGLPVGLPFSFFAFWGRRQLVQDYVLWHCAAINFYGTSGLRMSMWWATDANSYLSATQRVYVIFPVCVPKGDKWIRAKIIGRKNTRNERPDKIHLRNSSQKRSCTFSTSATR